VAAGQTVARIRD